jgi:hypothetical protein
VLLCIAYHNAGPCVTSRCVHRRGPYLLASDNINCGGLNVRVNGIYTRATTK